MGAGDARIKLIQEALRKAPVDALVCSFPSDVLMLTGYWPVIGTTVAIATAGGRVIAVAPDDEAELALGGWAEVRTFAPSSLDKLTRPSEAVVDPLAKALRDAGVGSGNIGHDGGPVSLTAPYSAVHVYGRAITTVLRQAAPSATFFNAMQAIVRLRATKTADEIACIRHSCKVATVAFAEGKRGAMAGLSEAEAAVLFRKPLTTALSCNEHRADGFTFCMSGPNGAQAHAAYARSRSRRIERGDLVLVHCNSYVDGYWTDITRTYILGRPDANQQKLYDAVFEARDAALKAVSAGAKAKAVDGAARAVLTKRGYGKHFRHSTGHGVGFGAIDPNALPRLHPESPDVLEPGMVFNIEPAIYIEGYGGLRHCDVVALTDHGPEVLTPFQDGVEELVISAAA